MNFFVAAYQFTSKDIIISSAKIRYFTPCFLQDDHTSRYIIGIQVVLEISIHSSSGHIAKVHCRTPNPSYPVGMLNDVFQQA